MTRLQELKEGLISSSPEETRRIAGDIAKAMPENTVLALDGQLGSGKTTFVGGLAEAWGITEAITSPTFNLFYRYRGTRNLLHLDAYRLSAPEQWEQLLVEDFLESPWCLAVEWPERVADYLPSERWEVGLFIEDPGHHRIWLRTP